MRPNALGVLGLFGLALLGCSPGEPVRSHLAYQGMPIIGGVPDTTHPAVVTVFGMGTECTGTIFYVDTKMGVGYVITAAHCVLDAMTKQPATPQSIVQANDYNDPNAVQYNVLDAQADSLYQGMDNDFAIVRFQGATAQTPVMALMTPDQDKLQGGETVDFIGYGTTNGNDPNNMNSLRNHVKGTLTMVTPLTLEYDQTSGGPCSGDSGGPSISLVGGHELISGVTSYGDPTCVQYGVSGRVSAVFASFIQPFLQQHGITLGPGGTAGAGGSAGAAGGGGGSAVGTGGTGAGAGPGAGGAPVGAGGAGAGSAGAGGAASAPLCQVPAVAPSHGSCVLAGSPCNPVTNAGCAAGDACDVGQNGGYTCYPAPNTAKLCGACDPTNGPYCGGTLHCISSGCARFCCDAGDCGGGVCSKAQGDGTVGVCLASPGGPQGAGGTGAAGNGAAGSGTAGSGTAGSGTAGSGAAGGGTGSPAGGAGAASGATGAGPAGVGGGALAAGVGGASPSGSGASSANGASGSTLGDATAPSAAPRSAQSGGCSAGGRASGAPTVWPVAAAFALGLRRRRRAAAAA